MAGAGEKQARSEGRSAYSQSQGRAAVDIHETAPISQRKHMIRLNHPFVNLAIIEVGVRVVDIKKSISVFFKIAGRHQGTDLHVKIERTISYGNVVTAEVGEDQFTIDDGW